jgi:hypothetical protein
MQIANNGKQSGRQPTGEKKYKKICESSKNSYNPRPDFLHIFPTDAQEITP